MVETHDAAPAHVGSGRTVGFSLAVVSLLVVFSPLPLGSVSRWAQGGLSLVTALLLVLWFARARTERLKIRSVTIAALSFAAFMGLGLLQVVPLPIDIVRLVSPEAAAAHASASNVAPAFATLTLDADATIGVLLRFAIFAALFYVVVRTATNRSAIGWLAGAVVFAGLLQAAFATQHAITGNDDILGHVPMLTSDGFTGTFLNANDFAGFVGIALALAAGLWLAARGHARHASGRVARLLPALLLALVTAFAVAIVLARSRSALAATCCTGLLFTVAAGRVLTLRWRTIGLIATIASVLVAGQLIALELVLTWIDGGSEIVVSWADRFDLYQSAWTMAAHFPWSGCGLGAGPAVFPRFQSGRFGDRTAEHLHGDWLQIGCEAGVVGFTVLALAFALFWFSMYRRILRVSDPRLRWIGIGALASLAFVAFHGFLEGSLLRATANGVAASVCAGIAFAAGATGASVAPVPSRGRVVSLFRGAAAAVLVVGLVALPLRRAAAELEFNRHRAANGQAPDRYFFLGADEPYDGDDGVADRDRRRKVATSPRRIGEAIRLNPQNAAYAAAYADWHGRRHAGYLRREAERVAAERFGLSEGPAYEQLVAALAVALRPEGDDAVRAIASRAFDAANRAVLLTPTNPQYRLARASLRLSLGDAGAPVAARRDAAFAIRYAPSKPEILYRAAVLMLGTMSSDASAVDRSNVSDVLRRVLESDPTYEERVYDLVASGTNHALDLRVVLPAEGPAYRTSIDRLCRAGRWELVAAMFSAGDQGRANEAREVPSALDLFRASRHVLALGRLGRWDRRRTVVERLRRLEAIEHDRWCAEAEASGSSRAAFAFARVLRRDPSHLDALGGALALHAQHGSSEAAQDCGEPLALAVRFAGAVATRGPQHEYSSRAHDDAFWRELAEAIGRLDPETAADERTYAWARAAAFDLAGDDDRAIGIVGELASSVPDGWRFSHLVHAHAEALYHRRGGETDARRAAAVVRRIAPSFAPFASPAALLATGAEPDRAPSGPVRLIGATFGGRVELIAITARGGDLRTWWRIAASAPGVYRVSIAASEGVDTNGANNPSSERLIGIGEQRVETIFPVSFFRPSASGSLEVRVTDAAGVPLATENGDRPLEIPSATGEVER